MTVLFVGNIDESPSIEAKKFASAATLILPDNVNKMSDYAVAYISIGDHSIEDFLRCLDQAKELHYAPSNQWEHDETRQTTERWLMYFSHRKPVYNLPPETKNNFLKLADQRKSDKSQLWVVGDEIAAEIGLTPGNGVGSFLSKKLKTDASYLVDQSASIVWCSDQILRSDLRKDDKILWLLPPMGVINYYDLQVQRSIELANQAEQKSNNPQDNLEQLQNTNLMHINLAAIDRVINVTRLIGCDLVISTPPVNNAKLESELLDYLVLQKEFVHCYADSVSYLDLNFNGAGEGPGPLQHQKYADLFYPSLK